MSTLAPCVFDAGSKLNDTLTLVLAVLVLAFSLCIISVSISNPKQSLQAKHDIGFLLMMIQFPSIKGNLLTSVQNKFMVLCFLTTDCFGPFLAQLGSSYHNFNFFHDDYP